VVAAIGFVLAGVAAVPLLSVLVFLLSLIPLGRPLIWGGAAIWLFSHSETGRASLCWCGRLLDQRRRQCGAADADQTRLEFVVFIDAAGRTEWRDRVRLRWFLHRLLADERMDAHEESDRPPPGRAG
jgi:hypothetical protein